VVQLVLKEQPMDTFSAKIYLKDEESGRDFLVDFGQKRSVYY
jgi:hypothetical protein